MNVTQGSVLFPYISFGNAFRSLKMLLPNKTVKVTTPLKSLTQACLVLAAAGLSVSHYVYVWLFQMLK